MYTIVADHPNSEELFSGVMRGTTVRALVPGRFGQKIENNRFERYGQRTNKKYFKL